MKPFLLRRKMITQERLKELLHYESDTGLFTWRISRGTKKSGTIAGRLHPNGYVYIAIDRRAYLAHRLAWMYVHGAFPVGEPDHINRIRSDNRISNLRDVSSSENRKNIGLRKDNKSGFAGVYYLKADKKWRALIRKDGKRISLGCFDNPEAASAAYKKASIELYPNINGDI